MEGRVKSPFDSFQSDSTHNSPTESCFTIMQWFILIRKSITDGTTDFNRKSYLQKNVGLKSTLLTFQQFDVSHSHRIQRYNVVYGTRQTELLNLTTVIRNYRIGE